MAITQPVGQYTVILKHACIDLSCVWSMYVATPSMKATYTVN